MTYVSSELVRNSRGLEDSLGSANHCSFSRPALSGHPALRQPGGRITSPRRVSSLDFWLFLLCLPARSFGSTDAVASFSDFIFRRATEAGPTHRFICAVLDSDRTRW